MDLPSTDKTRFGIMLDGDKSFMSNLMSKIRTIGYGLLPILRTRS